jgi:hypothetical protein
MRQTHPEVNHVIQLAAGIANFGVANVTTAKAHFAPLSIALQRQLHIPVLEPVVPSGLGMFGPTKAMARKFDEAVIHSLDDYPNARVLFIAHSLGGLLSREHFLTSEQTRDRYIGLITLGTPHLGADTKRWRAFKPIVDNINGFANEVLSGFNEVGESKPLTMTATTRDYIVTPESALPPIDNADRHLFAHHHVSTASLDGAQRHPNLFVEHIGLVVHPLAIMQTISLARTMLKNASQDINPLQQTA